MVGFIVSLGDGLEGRSFNWFVVFSDRVLWFCGGQEGLKGRLVWYMLVWVCLMSSLVSSMALLVCLLTRLVSGRGLLTLVMGMLKWLMLFMSKLAWCLGMVGKGG